ncbi:hypothetical protein DENIS_0723 [Desulfonema ishimotonii]|uniref:Uncharacterized protein n=1 Tax=Desulfonema ishimotonii TaxID=45657 RepID=A0A401FS31_9BACT|nr:hypothetical protein [Desulfonema ishimotonii]GBC59782.1 hypothetical protein DENIS_0723 [Desulfonema ishimotonii]
MTENYEGSEFRSWVILCLIVAAILFKGAFAFFVVGDRGQPDWAYRPVRDVPASSPFAVYEKLPNPQHVKGRGGE